MSIEKPTSQTPETPVKIKRFSNEQREALDRQGFVIYGLTGQSIQTLKVSGRRFFSTGDKNLPGFEAQGSMHSEVAINPNQPFLPKSDNKTLVKQEEMVEEFSQELGKKIQGVRAVIGQAPDYIELAFAHFDETKQYLFGAKDNYGYATTETPTSNSDVASVGEFRAFYGLCVDHLSRSRGNGKVFAAPLVVPV